MASPTLSPVPLLALSLPLVLAALLVTAPETHAGTDWGTTTLHEFVRMSEQEQALYVRGALEAVAGTGLLTCAMPYTAVNVRDLLANQVRVGQLEGTTSFTRGLFMTLIRVGCQFATKKTTPNA